jgi:hypothetical protein
MKIQDIRMNRMAGPGQSPLYVMSWLSIDVDGRLHRFNINIHDTRSG